MISSSVSFSILSTFCIAIICSPSTFGSIKAISSPSLKSKSWFVKFTTGVGQKRPFSSFMLFATEITSFFPMKPSKGVKYPAPSITRFAAAAELTVIFFIVLAESKRATFSSSVFTIFGISSSEPCGFIIFFPLILWLSALL